MGAAKVHDGGATATAMDGAMVMMMDGVMVMQNNGRRNGDAMAMEGATVT